MSVLLSAVILPLGFMLSPLLPPLIGAGVGAVTDRMRRDTEDPMAVKVAEAKARTASSRPVTSAAQVA